LPYECLAEGLLKSITRRKPSLRLAEAIPYKGLAYGLLEQYPTKAQREACWSIILQKPGVRLEH
jgi:hypothetical protein